MPTFSILVLLICAMSLAECFVLIPVQLSGKAFSVQKVTSAGSFELLLRTSQKFAAVDEIRRSRISARASSRASISAAVSAATGKWEVLEKFQKTANMDDFVVRVRHHCL